MKTYAVIWTLPAIASLRSIFNFIKTGSPSGAKNVVTALVTAGNSLSRLPARNPLEPLLADEPVIYRFIVKWNYKIIYTIEEDSVMIVDVFDTRRSPDRLRVNPDDTNVV